MNERKRTLAVGAAIAALAVGSLLGSGAGNGWWQAGAAVRSVLSLEAQGAVLDALVGPEGEDAAYASYAAVIERYGSVSPFAHIMASETRHIDALKRILDRYGVPYPEENPYHGTLEAPKSLADAALAGVEAEIANAALYEEQLEAVAQYPAIIRVFVSLQTASREQHLPAFERTAERY